MTLLAINTCERACSILLRTGNGDILSHKPMNSGQDRELAKLVQAPLQSAKITVRDLDKIAVAIGPGSFTAVRIGVAFARGLALIAGQPAIGINLLQVLAQQALLTGVGLGVGVKNVGRGQWAWCALGAKGLKQQPTTGLPNQIIFEANQLAQGQKVRFAGDSNPIFSLEENTVCDMKVFADLASEFDTKTHPASPWYARPPDAKLPGGIDPWQS